jgi:hypothetical protein
MLIAEGKILQTSRQMQDYLLCEECEIRFREHGEDWTLANYFHKGRFPLRERLDSVEPVIKSNTIRVFATRDVPGVEMDKLCYFAASIFWRAAAHEWTTVNGKTHIDLGPYEEPLRRFLMHEAPFPEQMTLTVRISALPSMLERACAPEAEPSDGFHYYGFQIPGLEFRLAVGGRIPAEYHQYCAIRSSGRYLFVVNQADIDSLLELAQYVAGARHVGRSE